MRALERVVEVAVHGHVHHRRTEGHDVVTGRAAVRLRTRPRRAEPAAVSVEVARRAFRFLDGQRDAGAAEHLARREGRQPLAAGP